MPFTLAWKQGYLKANPLAGLPSIKAAAGSRTEKGLFSPEEIAKLIAIAPLDWKGAILAGYYISP